MDKKITIAQIKEVAQQAYDLYKTNTDGKNADYIPYLANINKTLIPQHFDLTLFISS